MYSFVCLNDSYYFYLDVDYTETEVHSAAELRLSQRKCPWLRTVNELVLLSGLVSVHHVVVQTTPWPCCESASLNVEGQFTCEPQPVGHIMDVMGTSAQITATYWLSGCVFDLRLIPLPAFIELINQREQIDRKHLLTGVVSGCER